MKNIGISLVSGGTRTTRLTRTAIPTKEGALSSNKHQGICAKQSIGLYQCASNDKEVLKTIPADERADCVRDIEVIGNSTAIEKFLGIQWSLGNNCFRFRITLKDRPATRRGILSSMSAVYAPLGFLSPVVLSGKRILQDICRDQTNWDAMLSGDLVSRRRKWCSGLSAL